MRKGARLDRYVEKREVKHVVPGMCDRKEAASAPGRPERGGSPRRRLPFDFLYELPAEAHMAVLQGS